MEIPAPRRPSSGSAGIHDAVGELLEGIEQQDEDERGEYDQIVGFDQRDQFGRLVEFFDVEEQDGHRQCEDDGDREIGEQGVFELAADAGFVVGAEQLADEWRQPVGKPVLPMMTRLKRLLTKLAAPSDSVL